MKKLIALLLVELTLIAPAMAKIQDADVKSLSEVGSVASRLTHTDKLYDVLNSQQLSTTISNGQIGSGSATNGYVLTANGSGGTSWAAAGGSSSTTSTEWASYTPTFGSDFGTVSNVSFYWRRVGDSMQVRGVFTTGTVGGSGAGGGITLANSKSIDSAKIPANNNTSAGPIIGHWSHTGHANYAGSIVTATSSSTSVVYISNQDNNSGLLVPNAFGNIGFSNTLVSVDFDVPISGWTNNN